MKNPCLSIVLAFVFLVGCATNFETRAYQAVAATAQTVDSSRKGWNDWVLAGRATTNQVMQVHAAYGDYQKAMAAAQLALNAYRTSPTNELVLQKALDALGAASGDVMGLISTLKK